MADSFERVNYFKELLYGLRRLGYYTDMVGPVDFEEGSRYLVRVRKGSQGIPFYFVEGQVEHIVLSLEYMLAFRGFKQNRDE